MRNITWQFLTFFIPFDSLLLRENYIFEYFISHIPFRVFKSPITEHLKAFERSRME